MLRFYDIEQGRILIDGQDIATVTQDSLRAQIGMVTQDTSLLHRSVRDNLLYGRPDAGDEAMIHAAKQAEATKPASARVEKVVRNKDLVEKARLLAKISRVNIDKQTMRRELAAMKTVDRGHPDYQKEMKNNKRYLKECMSMHGLDDDIDVNLRFDGEDAIFTISRRDYPDSRVEYRGTEVYQLSYLDNVLNVKKLLEKMDVNALRATRITPKPLASKYIMTVADRMRTLNPDSETDDHWDMANIIHHVDRRCTEAFGE